MRRSETPTAPSLIDHDWLPSEPPKTPKPTPQNAVALEDLMDDYDTDEEDRFPGLWRAVDKGGKYFLILGGFVLAGYALWAWHKGWLPVDTARVWMEARP